MLTLQSACRGPGSAVRQKAPLFFLVQKFGHHLRKINAGTACHLSFRRLAGSVSMNASGVMTTKVITAKSEQTMQEVAELLLVNHISGMPVVDQSGKLVGMISEGDLLRRADEGVWPQAWGPPPRRGWMTLLMDGAAVDTEHVQRRDRKVADIMTREIISAKPETSISDIAALLVHHRIKRVPIVQDGEVVGIVSRANLIQAFAGR
jgi:CBS domain-containing protein